MKRLPDPCPACGALDSRLALSAPDFMLQTGEAFHLHRCARCGLTFQKPFPSPETLARHYPETYGPYGAAEMRAGATLLRELSLHRGYAHLDAPRAPLWKRPWGRYLAEAALVPGFVPGGSVLEIGCASGARLELLRRLGWERCMGIEFHAGAAARARERGFEVHAGRVEDALRRVPDASLDAVVAGFVMEHLENPFETTRALAAKLKPGGQLLFSTITLGSPDFRWFGKYWYNLDLPRHRVLFRKSDLRRLLPAGFAMERLTYLAAPNDLAGSARYRLRHAPRPGDRLLALAGNRLLPLCLLLAALRQTGRVAVRCRRA